MDDELKELALLALKNAFYQDFSVLVNTYFDTAEGLDTQTQTLNLCEAANVHSRDDTAKGSVILDIWTKYSGFNAHRYDTLCHALEDPAATEVHLCGRKVFERVCGEWRYCE